jgi:hypothetical protein
LEDDSSSEASAVNQDISSINATIPRMSSAMLRMSISFASYDQLAHQLTLVSHKWYRLVCSSDDSLWDQNKELILKPSSTLGEGKKGAHSANNKNVFEQTYYQHESKPSVNASSLLTMHPFRGLTTVVDRRRANQKTTSAARRDFIFAYRRHILCERFFREMELEDVPPLDPSVRAALDRFQKESNICLPLTLYHLLQRHNIHRSIPHLGYANLVFDKLEYMELPSNRILLRWMCDCQGCWTGFVAFDRDPPVPDPPVYSEIEGVDFTIGFHEFIRRYDNGIHINKETVDKISNEIAMQNG